VPEPTSIILGFGGHRGDKGIELACRVAWLLRNAPSAVARRRRLAALVSDSVADSSLELLDTRTVFPEMPITEALQFICERPVPVVDRMHADVIVDC
jgi:hypothetical protein